MAGSLSKGWWGGLMALFAMMLLVSCTAAPQPATRPTSVPPPPTPVAQSGVQEIYLAGGCFWGVEAYFERIDGVVDAVSGYANGTTADQPSYGQVVSQKTGHAETVRVSYDLTKLTLDEILIYYVRIIDPTSVNKQGPDVGPQYRTGIYSDSEEDLAVAEYRMAQLQKTLDDAVAVEVEPLDNFWEAEEYHQDYLVKNPGGYCHVNLELANQPVIRVADYPRPTTDELRAQLTEEQYRITQEDGTEPPFDNEYVNNEQPGIYVDIVTGEPLFSSADKFDSGSGWPSFTKPIVDYVVSYHPDGLPLPDGSEVRSRAGDSHLGHVFLDGPTDRGGLRYCINSAALRFVPVDELVDAGYGDLQDLAGLE